MHNYISVLPFRDLLINIINNQVPRGQQLLKILYKISNLFDFVQDFTPDFNYIIFLIVKGDSVFMEDRVVNPRKSSIRTLKPHLVRLQSFQVRCLPSVISRNHQYL